MSGALGQQFPDRNTAFQGPDGRISPAWFRFLNSLWIRTGGGTPSTTTDGLQTQITNLNAAKLNKAGGTMTGALALAADPTSPLQAATKNYVDISGAASKVSKSGDTMTGPLILPGSPLVALSAATKGYVDTGDALALPLAGGTMTGALVLSGAPTVGLNPATKTYTDAGDALAVPLAGGTMTGLLVLSGAPAAGLNPATKTYTDNADALRLLLTGGTLSGALTAPYYLTTTYTVATLPAAGAGLTGARAFVTDAAAPAWNAAVVGGGAVKVPVFCDGTTWKAG